MLHRDRFVEHDHRVEEVSRLAVEVGLMWAGAVVTQVGLMQAGVVGNRFGKIKVEVGALNRFLLVVE